MRVPDITSRRNPRVKSWRALRTRSERARTGRFLVEGERETVRAVQHLHVVESIIRIDRLPIDLPNPTTVSDSVFEAISSRRHSDGIAAIASIPDLSITSFDPPSPRLVLVADGIEKPGNLGAMIRTADGLGAAVVGSELATDVVNPNVVRAAQGSLFSIPIAEARRSEATTWCAANAHIVAAVPVDGAAPWTRDLTGDLAIVVGSEHAGVDDSWLEIAVPITIPMVGVADSFNASVSAAILLSEAVRQRSD